MSFFWIMPKVGWETDELFNSLLLSYDSPSDASSVWPDLHMAQKSAIRILVSVHSSSLLFHLNNQAINMY